MTSTKGLTSIFRMILSLGEALRAVIFLIFGSANLIHPEVPDSFLRRNTQTCIMLIIVGLILLSTIIYPFSGGIGLCLLALIFFVITHNPLFLFIVLVGCLSIIHGLTGKEER